MEKTPNALRRHVVLLGRTNAGKSTLFNALTGQQSSIVSAQPGTTTDPVSKAMELLPYGPVVLIDTAGLGDDSPLGRQRMRQTAAVRRRADAVLYVAEAEGFDPAAYEAFRQEGIPHLLVFTKSPGCADLQSRYPGACFFMPGSSLAPLREKLSALLASLQAEEVSLLGGLVSSGANVLLVVPVDSGAPKGRLILPQVQVLRDCLDNGIRAMVCRELELEGALQSLQPVELVITDSQAFSYVAERIPAGIPLTSFSMLFARQKGNFPQLLSGVQALENLPDCARILMLEGCTHNHTHEDIGRVKIPALLQKRLGKRLAFDYYSGYDFPGNLSGYALAVQCGSCMLARRETTARLRLLAVAGLPVTNYGILLAWGAGILDRACEIFQEGEAPST